MFVHRFTLFALVIDVILLTGCLILYFSLIAGRTLTEAFNFIYEPDCGLTNKQKNTIEKRFGLIFFPIFLILLAKVITGFKMVRQRFHRPAFMKYYVTSWSFYGSFLMQMTLIILCSSSILRTWVNIVCIIGVIMFIPAWILMNIHMKLIRAQSIE